MDTSNHPILSSRCIHFGQRHAVVYTARLGGFTLIELLTVIAIIGILAAIIIPTVGKVRQSAYRATCASNIRQLGVAILSYAQDHRDQLPDQSPTNPGTGLDGQVSGNYEVLTTHIGPRASLVPHLVPYLGLPTEVGTKLKAAIVTCPASERAIPDEHASFLLNPRVRLTNGDLRRPFGYSSGDSETRKSRRISDIDTPSQAVALFDLDAEIWKTLGNANPTGVPTTAVHGNVRNFLYFDAHVKAQPLSFDPRAQ